MAVTFRKVAVPSLKKSSDRNFLFLTMLDHNSSAENGSLLSSFVRRSGALRERVESGHLKSMIDIVSIFTLPQTSLCWQLFSSNLYLHSIPSISFLSSFTSFILHVSFPLLLNLTLSLWQSLTSLTSHMAGYII